MKRLIQYVDTAQHDSLQSPLAGFQMVFVCLISTYMLPTITNNPAGQKLLAAQHENGLFHVYRTLLG